MNTSTVTEIFTTVQTSTGPTTTTTTIGSSEMVLNMINDNLNTVSDALVLVANLVLLIIIILIVFLIGKALSSIF